MIVSASSSPASKETVVSFATEFHPSLLDRRSLLGGHPIGGAGVGHEGTKLEGIAIHGDPLGESVADRRPVAFDAFEETVPFVILHRAPSGSRDKGTP